ncbi:TetR/AcrR family transcriptional regulator [Paenibacillus sp. H1-7]|uniref:TetR/AcrR family transcriptional regulator n=1 Tax=Paenibacillus sp. H1-7 TaxID=2282849 RepID=UPI001EF8AB3F|nr:TetR/AcrR family transcriptional regulator [Paenibacillus sp. H1-7]ULL19638.1 TetR/AcrR family transcriptional regulator [Paenibacillus sp. H1-7]
MNRKQVIEVAAQLFLIRGYAFTSMDDVMRESQVSKSNIYYHFKSKEELLLAAVEYWIERYEAAFFALLGQAERSVEERVYAFLHELTAGIEERECQGGCPFISFYIQAPDQAVQVKQKITGFFTELQPMLAKLFQQGLKRNEFRRGIGAEQAAALFIAAMEGALVLAETTGRSAIVEETAQHFFSMLR